MFAPAKLLFLLCLFVCLQAHKKVAQCTFKPASANMCILNVHQERGPVVAGGSWSIWREGHLRTHMPHPLSSGIKSSNDQICLICFANIRRNIYCLIVGRTLEPNPCQFHFYHPKTKVTALQLDISAYTGTEHLSQRDLTPFLSS